MVRIHLKFLIMVLVCRAYVHFVSVLYVLMLSDFILFLCYNQNSVYSTKIWWRPVSARGRCGISPPRFLAECCKRQLNQGSFLLLYFRLSTFSDLYWVCLSVFSCTVLFVSISQVIGCEDRLRNDLYCVELKSTPTNERHSRETSSLNTTLRLWSIG